MVPLLFVILKVNLCTVFVVFVFEFCSKFNCLLVHSCEGFTSLFFRGACVGESGACCHKNHSNSHSCLIEQVKSKSQNSLNTLFTP